MKKTLTTVIAGMAFVALSGLAFAGQPANADPNQADFNVDSAIAQDGSTAVYVDDVTKKDFNNSFNEQETKTVTVTKTVDIQDSFKTDESVKDSFNEKDSYNTNNSYNVDESIRDSYNEELTISDIKIAVAKSELSGEVSGNTVAGVDTLTTGNARISDNAFQYASGIFPVAQNTGVNSQIQQSVNVQAFGLK